MQDGRNKLKKVLIILIVFLSLCSCNNKETTKNFSYTKIDNKKMTELMQDHDYTIIDVRSKEEYSGEHIKGAHNIPHDTISKAVLPSTEIIFVYCASGGRSKIAAENLIDLGYKVYDLGGIDEIDLPKE